MMIAEERIKNFRQQIFAVFFCTTILLLSPTQHCLCQISLDPVDRNLLENSTASLNELTALAPKVGIKSEKEIRLNISPNELKIFPKLGSLQPIRLDASYSEPITLRDALSYAIANNLPIKISRESWKFQRYQFYASMGQFLPNNTLLAGVTTSNVYSTGTLNTARLYQEALYFPVFQGGLILNATLSQYYRAKAFRHAYNSTINDTLLSVYKNYTYLQFNGAILKIRAKAVAVSETELEINQQLYKSGKCTRLAVAQSKAQLASDQQALLDQQLEYRKAALYLADGLNLPLSINLIPAEDSVSQISLIDEKAELNDFIKTAMSKRPELRQFEYFRLAAARNAQATAYAFYPSLNFFLSCNHINTTVRGPLIGVNGIANGTIAANQVAAYTPVVTSTALGQQANFSASGSTTGNQGANTGAATTVAGGGGSPTASIQSGGLVTSGGAAPTFVGNATATPFNYVNGTTVTSGIFPGLFNTVQAGFQLNWTVPNSAIGAASSVLAAKALGRQALNQANQQLSLVMAQIRADYTSILAARRQAEVTRDELAASSEALRMSTLRLRAGAGVNLEVIKAQRRYVNALIASTGVVLYSGQLQAQLLHDIGTISLDTLAPKSTL
ncbi:MAG: TolC family protein [Candidatus Obscuribacterales bacterium]|nr:TolC family protein [Candidatus Obscuribacterales bacterium]